MAVRIAFIGAGGVNFGGHGNTWDHATRIEKLGGVEVVGIADLNVPQAERVLAVRKAKPEVGKLWAQCEVYQDYKVMLTQARPDCVFIGVPPGAHGSSKQPIELACAEAGVHMFIEKPISCAHPDAMAEFVASLKAKSRGLVVSVAYMFRYSSAIRRMKSLVASLGPARLVQARYNAAYSNIGAFWFDVARSGGPVVEQATHFVDLARYFCGDADLDTVTAMAIKATDPMGELAKLPVDEAHIPPEHRVPRVTNAMWKFQSGAMGALSHTALLHGWAYETQFEVLGDGYQLTLTDPYGKCELYVRSPGCERGQIEVIEANDAYLEEITAFVEACRSGDQSRIASPYEDAFKTYQLTWAIRNAAEGNDKGAVQARHAARE